MRPLIAGGLCLALAGCNATFPESFVGQANNARPIQAYALGQPDAPVPAEAMLLLPPEAGGVLRIRERHFRNGTRQEIVLAGASSGENVLDVSLRTAGGDNAARGDLQIGKPSQRGIASEAQGRFPGVKMHAVTRPMSNVFGPFGLAIGRRGNERCVFGWQWIDDLRASSTGSRSPLASMLSGGAMPASVRVRMCRNNATLDEMAAFMEGLRPVAPAIDRVVRLDRRMVSSQGVAAAAPLTQGGGVTGGVLAAPMSGGSLEAALPGSTAPAPRVASAPRPAASPPPASRVTRAAPPPVRTPEFRPETIPQQTGPRYLAPVEGGLAQPNQGPIAVSGPIGAGRLDSSLPSRAYLGPGSNNGQR